MNKTYRALCLYSRVTRLDYIIVLVVVNSFYMTDDRAYSR